jgi:hypothetical protein
MRQIPSETHLRHMQGAKWMVDHLARYWSGLGTVQLHLFQSSPLAGPPARRLADAIWRGYWRHKFPRPELIVAEENAYAHLVGEHASLPKAGMYQVWQAIEAYRALREAKWGGSLLTYLRLPDLDAMPDRGHQQAVFRLAHRSKEQMLYGSKLHWVHEAERLTMRIDPNTSMVKALELYAQWVFYRLSAAEGDSTTQQLTQRYALKFWTHYRGNPWLAKTPIGQLVDLLPQQAALRSA